MATVVNRAGACALVGAVFLAACSDDADPTTTDAPAVTEADPDLVAPTDAPPSSEPPPATAPPTSGASGPLADGIDVRPGVEQVTVTGAEPGVDATAIALPASGELADGETVAQVTVDDFGAVLFRDLDSGLDHVVIVDGGASEPLDVFGRDEHPPAAFYAEQRLPAPGFGYLVTRDGTTLSVNVVLPGSPEDGPYPTVVEYSGYTPSDPEASGLKDLFPALGYAYVGVNMRGSGCSGGSFRFFEYAQSLDGYDAIETIAAQPWVQDNRVGMVGVSYPGISQLFVAQTQPPNLAAITPLSVLDDSYRSTLYPGGILNTGFAVEWTQDRVDDGRPAVDPLGELTGDGQAWAGDRIAAGDDVCAANQQIRLQNPDLVQEIVDTPFYDPAVGDELAPRLFVDRVTVPTFMAGAWQDEQTGGRFPTMIPEFTGTERLYVSLVNGLHIESISPGVFPRYLEFLDLYVAERTPSFAAANAVVPLLAGGLFGTGDVQLPDDRFAGLDHADALAAFEAEPPIEVLFEQGAAEGADPLTPLPRFAASFDEWPIERTESRTWYLGTGQSLEDRAAEGAPQEFVDYLALPDGIPMTFWDGNSSDLWRTDVVWDWREPAPGTVASFLSAPLDETQVMIGSGSVDLWVDSSLGDTDLEVTLSEVRPDGTETYVQSGWLRASQRALDADATELRPTHTHLESDVEQLPGSAAGETSVELALARIELFPFAHVFRNGSQVRLSVDAPGGNRAVWEFATIANGEQVTIGLGGTSPSKVVLPVVPEVQVPDGAPPCGSLRGQPCRAFAPGT